MTTRTVARVLVIGWLLVAVLVLGMDGRLPAFLAMTMPASGVVMVVAAVLRQQLAPSRYNRPSLPERYRLADDLRVPLCMVVAVAESEAGSE